MSDKDISAAHHKPANVSEELVNFAQTKVRSPLLNKLYEALKTIPPSSIESERAFSITGQFITKLRTQLGDDSIDSLVYLKSHYKKSKKEDRTENVPIPKLQPDTPKITKSQPETPTAITQPTRLKTPVAGTLSQAETPKSSRPSFFKFKSKKPQLLIDSEDSDETQMETD